MNCRAMARANNIKPPTDQLHPLLHAEHPNADFEPGHLFPLSSTGRDSATGVANFQYEMRVAMHSYPGLLTPGMALDIGEAFLHDSE